MIRPNHHHGANPATRGMGGKALKALLKHEARWRAAGDWGRWEQFDRGSGEYDRLLADRHGWVLDCTRAYRNRVFCVLERPDVCGPIHVAVASLSGIRPTWYEMQRIKDELFGPLKTAVELYPPSDEVIDGSDMFHIWILPFNLPFGLTYIPASRAAAGVAAILITPENFTTGAES